MSGSGIVGHMQICTLTQTYNQLTMPASHHSVFYRPDAIPATQPAASMHCFLSDINENVLHFSDIHNVLMCVIHMHTDILEPCKPRPETTASTARNLVHGALGLRRPSSKEHTKEVKEHKRHSSKSDGKYPVHFVFAA